jgi:periodic tryptophan protein 2
MFSTDLAPLLPQLWNAASGFCFVTFTEHKMPITAVAFAPSGHAVLSASLDGTVRAFDLVRYRNFRTFTSPSPAQFVSLAVDNSGEVVVAGSLDTFQVRQTVRL